MPMFPDPHGLGYNTHILKEAGWTFRRTAIPGQTSSNSDRRPIFPKSGASWISTTTGTACSGGWAATGASR